MSATGRSLLRQQDPLDFFETPAWCVEKILPHLGPPTSVVDPFCGNGAILREVGVRWPGKKRFGFDVAQPADWKAGIAGYATANALDPRMPWPGNVVVTNPPYSSAMEAVLRALGENKRVAAFLLRLNWLGSGGRADFHKQHPSDIYILSERPSFAWVFSCGRTPKAERCEWIIKRAPSTPTPEVCGGCGCEDVNKTTSDACEYAWFCWGEGRGGRWGIL